MLDIRTILFTAMITEVVCTLVVVALWRQTRRRFSGLALWNFSFACSTTGLLLIVLRGLVPDWVSIVLSNVLIMAGIVILLIGLEEFVGRRGPRLPNYLLLVLFTLVHFYLTFVRPDLAARNLNITVAGFILFSQCMWLMLRRVERAMRPLTRLVGVVFGIYVMVCIARMIRYVIQPYENIDFFQGGAFKEVVMASYLVLFILLTYSLALMVIKRLLAEIRFQEEKFSKAFHFSPYAVFLTRLADGRVFEVNEGFSRATGFSVDEVLGKDTVNLHLWASREEREAMVGELRRQGRIESREQRFRKKNGEFITGLYSAEIITINNESCILSVINDITERKRAEEERERLVSEREKAFSEIQTLSGMLPICAHCKKVRDDRGYWNQIETYIESHTEAEFSHGICPDCMRELYPEFARKSRPD
jgi:PAS domain S-box-containing protein